MIWLGPTSYAPMMQRLSVTLMASILPLRLLIPEEPFAFALLDLMLATSNANGGFCAAVMMIVSDNSTAATIVIFSRFGISLLYR